MEIEKENTTTSVGLKLTTRLKILEITKEDYIEQLEELKKNKEKYDYKEYRKTYQRLCNLICYNNREIKKAKGEIENGN